jgi:methyltransferase
MVTSVALYLGFIGLLYLERLAELILSSRNAAKAFRAGGAESGRGHYLAMVCVHALFPAACAVEVLACHRSFPGVLGVIALGAALAAQALRWWVIATLGWRWNTRIIVVPGAPVVTGGPYRVLRHPNYLAVIVEALAVPLVHGAWISALSFGLANAVLLAIRIPAEERALGASWATALEGRPRLIPGMPHG